MNTKKVPMISIGLPVFNGELLVGRAIAALLEQTESNFELIISDNASTDRTAEAIELATRGDERVRYFRQPTNIGAVANFEFVMERATAPYFMWAASDDHWHPEFISTNVSFLEAHPDFVTSISQVAFDDCDNNGVAMGTFPLVGSAPQNVCDFICRPGGNSRYYGVHRTWMIQKAWLGETFWASDWAVICRTLLHGKHNEVPRLLMWRSSRGESSDSCLTIRKWQLGWVNTLFPMLRFSRFVMSLPDVRNRPRIWARLVLINVALTQRMIRSLIRSWADPRLGHRG